MKKRKGQDSFKLILEIISKLHYLEEILPDNEIDNPSDIPLSKLELLKNSFPDTDISHFASSLIKMQEILDNYHSFTEREIKAALMARDMLELLSLYQVRFVAEIPEEKRKEFYEQKKDSLWSAIDKNHSASFQTVDYGKIAEIKNNLISCSLYLEALKELKQYIEEHKIRTVEE